MQLLKVKGVFPYSILVFLNTFVDVGHKVLIQDALYQTMPGSRYTILSAIINALILIPYLLLFTPSGFIADKFPKATVLKVTAAVAVPLTILVTWCYFIGFFWGAFLSTLLLATQSALNSPAKYGYIKEMFGKENLSEVNAIVQTLTITAILGSTFIFTYFFSYFITLATLQQSDNQALLLKAFAPSGFLLIICSTFETLMTFYLVKNKAADPYSYYKFDQYFQGKYLKAYLKKAKQPPTIFTCIIGLSIFWAVNQVLLASYGAFLKEHLKHASVLFAQGSLAMGGVGILLGALYAGKVSKGFVETGLIPVAAIGIALGLFILPVVSSPIAIVTLFLVYGFFGGMLIVPLNALIQFNAAKQEIGKVLSANNFVQNCFMFGFLILTVLFSFIGIDSLLLLNGLFLIALGGAIYTIVALPQSLIRYVLYFVASRFYRLRVYQLNNVPSSGGVLLLGNHVSFIDWTILQIACPRPIRFVMDRSIYETWYLNWIFKKCKVIPIAKANSHQSLQEINKALNNGEVVALFPEGRLSRNGQMGIFKPGFERSAVNAKAVIVPFYIHGLWGSKFSYASQSSKELLQANQNRVSVTYGTAIDIQSSAQTVRQKVRELSILAWSYSIHGMNNIQTEWLYKAKNSGHTTAIIEENGNKISTGQLLGAVLFLRRKLIRLLANQQNIGVLLPTEKSGVMTNLVILFLGKTTVNLNYTSSASSLESAIKQTAIQTIISSRQFLKKLEGRGFQLEPSLAGANIIYLEDVISIKSKKMIFAYSVLAKIMPRILIKLFFLKYSDINSTAAILFSSGSEGIPKGVMLSHANLLSNIIQVVSIINLEPTDVMVSALPLFHAFGLTITLLMPLLKGIPMLCYPDPTKSLAIAKLIFIHKATLYCSTSSLLGLYTRNASIYPQMLASLRLVIAGAEKLSPAVYQDFKNKFNLEIYEGYGATEVAPVASCNLPDVITATDWHIHKANKPGTVGLPLPGCAFRIVDPTTLKDLPIGEDGLILIGGTQVMQGYVNLPDKTREVLIEDDHYTWYKTGDKGHLDSEGFLTIVDRYARFAKIAGEMVSLGQVEQEWCEVTNIENIEIMALALPDEKKGEQLALLYVGDVTEAALKKGLLNSKLPKLMLPTQIKQVKELPKLGNGKRDYQMAKQMFYRHGENK